ncbi:MAG: DUF2071 domain-containing protein [Chloroflexota bacterium]
MNAAIAAARSRRARAAAPPPGPLAALTTLEDIAIVTYDVAPEALAALLPDWAEPDVLTLADGRRRALVSAVTFRDVDFRFRLLPFVRLGMLQTNYRAYVRTGGERAVWFLGSTLTSRSVEVPRRLWSMPWHRVEATLEATWDGVTCTRWRSTVTGSWGGMDVQVEGTDEPMGTLDGLADEAETARVLTHPLTGYYRRLDGRVAGYRVWHAPMRPTRGRLVHGRYDALEQAGLVTPGQEPHSVLLDRRSDFIVYLPPSLLGQPLGAPEPPSQR